MTARIIRPRRSFIFAPGTRPDMFPKALASGADIVCVDLEDAVAPAEKAAARDKTLALFDEPQAEDGDRESEDDVERIVRVNCLRTPEGMADVQALLVRKNAPPALMLPALMLPKVKGPEEVRGLAELLDEFDRPCRLHVIIETNEGLEAAHDALQSATGRSAGGRWKLRDARRRVDHRGAGALLRGLATEATSTRDLTGGGGRGQTQRRGRVVCPRVAEIRYGADLLRYGSTATGDGG